MSSEFSLDVEKERNLSRSEGLSQEAIVESTTVSNSLFSNYEWNFEGESPSSRAALSASLYLSRTHIAIMDGIDYLKYNDEATDRYQKGLSFSSLIDSFEGLEIPIQRTS